MDDASRIQQINNLARELMKHGQAVTMEEAMQKAQAQINNIPEREPAPPVSLSNPSTQVTNLETEQIQPNQEQEITSEPNSQVFNNNQEHFDKLNGVVMQQQTAISNVTNTVQTNTQNIEGFNLKINEIIADLAQVKNRLDKLLSSPVTPPLNKEAVTTGQTQIKPDPTVQQTQPKKPSEGHARSGNYKPDDVSIEKFFYCGPK